MKKLLSITIVLLFSLALLSNCNVKAKKETKKKEVKSEEVKVNALTDAEKEDSWVLLFDGETSEGWRGFRKDHFPANWKVEDGTLFCMGSGRSEAGAADGGDIIYDEEFDNFHLKLEWKISKGGNSGIFYLGQESDEFDYIWKTAPEMQVLDNVNHPDAEAGIKGTRQAGSLYDLVSAEPQNAKSYDEWNQVEIKVFKGTVFHIQNGETVVEYHLWTPEWNEMVAKSKFPALNKDWAEVASKGYIGLQDHGDDVWYRNNSVLNDKKMRRDLSISNYL